MSRQARGLVFVCVTLASTLAPSLTRAGIITQDSSIPLTATDFGQGNNAGASLVFQQFDTKGDALQLDAVKLNFHAMIKNDFQMQFTSPSTITLSVAATDANHPSPTITMYQPDGIHPILTAQAPNDPSVLTRSVTYGFKDGETLPQSFGSDLPASSPFYLPQAVSQASSEQRLTAPADLKLFTGPGSITLPVSAKAFSQFGSGNGFGAVTTFGKADVTVSYEYHSKIPAGELVPEPASVLLWGLGGASLLALHRFRRRND
ncbi:MAG: hypothetical protein NVSMB9_34440 [Isosphaeraceae bacterium]